MTLETELARWSALDLGKANETFSGTRESLSAVTGGLKSLGMIDEDVVSAVNLASGALQILTGFASLGRLAKTATEARTSVKTAEAGALTTAVAAMGPMGWARIALAAGTMATVGAVMYQTVSTVRLGSFDLSSSSGQSSAVRAVTEAMA